MNTRLFINEVGDLRLHIYPDDNQIGTIEIQPEPGKMKIEMKCYNCREWMYDAYRKAGCYYCTKTKRNQTIHDINKVPKWCPLYKHLLQSFDLR